MADLDAGFEEVQLDDGFQEIPLHPEEQAKLKQYTKLQSALAGAKEGLTLGTSAELGGVEQALLDLFQSMGHVLLPSMVGASPTQIAAKLKADRAKGDIGPSTTFEMYRQAQKEGEQELKEAKEENPLSYLGGELAGGLAGGIGTSGAVSFATKGVRAGLGLGEEVALKGLSTSGKAAELGKRAISSAIPAAGMGVVAGAGSSEGKLIDSTPEEKQKLLEDVKSSAKFGAVTGGALGILGTGVKQPGEEATKIGDNDYFRQLALAFKEGRAGKGFSGVKQTAERLKQETSEAVDVSKKLLGAREQLGQNIDNVLTNASKQGVKIEPSETLTNAASDVQELLASKPTLLGKAETGKTLDKIDSLLNNQLDPKEANELRKTFRDLALTIQDTDYHLPLKRFSTTLNNDIEASVPGFKQANKLFYEYSKAGPESLLTKGLPVEEAGKFLSESKAPSKEVISNVEKVMKKMTAPGTSGEVEKKTFMEFMDNLKDFEKQNPGKLQELGIDLNKLEQGVYTQADLSAIRKTIQGYEPEAGWKSNLLGFFTPRGMSMRVANVAGKATGAASKPLELGKNLYQATDEELQSVIIPQLQEIPGAEAIIRKLDEAISSKDISKKNALLFSIMQNPKYKR